MRRLIDSENVELRAVLELLLAEDVDITTREVARRHSSLKNASAFTRNRKRMELIEEAQERQTDARHVKSGPERVRSNSLSQMLQERDRRVAELEGQVRSLVASHAACVRAVMISGGFSALRRFWVEYKAIGDGVSALGSVPAKADVVQLPIVDR